MALSHEWRRLVSIAALGVAFARQFFRRVRMRLFERPQPQLAAFAERYRADGVRFVPEAERARSAEAGACTACRTCDPVCPVVPAAASQGFIGPSRLILSSARLLPPAPGAWHDAFLCIRCGACDRACPEGISLDRLFGDMRATVAREAPGEVPAGLKDALAQAELTGHMSGAPPAAPRRDDGVPHDHTYVASCACRSQDVAAEAALLDAAGVDYGTAPDNCCGAVDARGVDAGWTGLSAALAHSKAFHVVTGDPRCYEHMRASPLYRDLHVRHILETTADVVLGGPGAGGGPLAAKSAPPPAVTFHDPCQLSRVPGGPALARDAIRRAGVPLVEMRLHGLEAPCCGMGGVTFSHAPALAEELGRRRVRDAVATGAATLLTQSPLCRDHLARCAALEGAKLEVKNVTELMAERLAARKSAPPPAAPAPALAPAPSPPQAKTPAAATAPAAAPRASPDPDRKRTPTPDPALSARPSKEGT